jgi:hypothetical protein
MVRVWLVSGLRAEGVVYSCVRGLVELGVDGRGSR